MHVQHSCLLWMQLYRYAFARTRSMVAGLLGEHLEIAQGVVDRVFLWKQELAQIQGLLFTMPIVCDDFTIKICGIFIDQQMGGNFALVSVKDMSVATLKLDV